MVSLTARLRATTDCQKRNAPMIVTNSKQRAQDILSSNLRTLLLFGLPSVIILATGVTVRSNLITWDFDGAWRGAIWAASMGVMAGACLVNAIRCGRTHCYVTGPFLILTAIASLGYGVGLLPLGAGGWNIIGMTTLGGAVLLTWLPEVLFGKYQTRDPVR